MHIFLIKQHTLISLTQNNLFIYTFTSHPNNSSHPNLHLDSIHTFPAYWDLTKTTKRRKIHCPRS